MDPRMDFNHKNGWELKNWCFWTVMLEKTLEIPLDSKVFLPWTNHTILKEISPEYSLQGLMLKLQYFGHLMWRADSIEKTLMLGKTEGKRRRGRQDEMVGWHHWLNGHEFGWTPGAGDWQGGLACCSSWACKESDMTEWLNWTELNMYSTLGMSQ